MCLPIIHAYLLLCLFGICTRPLQALRRTLIGKLLEKEHHELMTIMLHDRIEFSPQYFLDIRVDHPPLGLAALTENYVEELVKFVVVLEVVLYSLLVVEAGIILHDEIITQFINWEETLKAGIHVAVVSVVVEANYTILEGGWLLILDDDVHAVEVHLRLCVRYGMTKLDTLVFFIVHYARAATV